LAAAALGVRSVSIRERDIVFRTDRPGDVVTALRAGAPPERSGEAPSVIALPPKSNEELAEVYFRPPAAYLEPETLLAVLRRRLCAHSGPEPVPPAPARQAAAPTRAAGASVRRSRYGPHDH
jgi:hypothetical protein